MKHLQRFALGVCIAAALFAIIYLTFIRPSWLWAAVVGVVACYGAGQMALEMRDSRKRIREYRERRQSSGTGAK
jgi:hypothetical protein